MNKSMACAVNNNYMTIYIDKEAILYLCFNLILLTTVAIVYGNFGIVIIGMLGTFISIICANGVKDNIYSYMLIAIFIMTVFLLFHYNMLIEKYGIPYYAGDDEHFEGWGHYLYENGYFFYSDLKKVVFTNQSNARGYPLLLARIELLVNLFGGYHTIMPRILNLYLWLSTALLTLKLLQLRVDEPKVQKALFFGLALFPNGVYLSSFVYREAVMEFLMIVIVYNMLLIFHRWRRFKLNKSQVISFALILLSIFYLSYLRVTMIFVCVIFGVILYLDKHQNVSKSKKAFLYMFVGMTIIAVALSTNIIGLVERFSTNYSNYILSHDYGLSSKIFSMPILPIGWIIRILYGLACPFPGGLLSLDFAGSPLYSLCQAMVFIGTIFQIFLLPYAFRGLRKKNCYAVMYFASMCVICVTTFTFRHFLMPLPFLALTAAEMYLDTDAKAHNRYLAAVGIGLIGMAAVYVVIK